MAHSHCMGLGPGQGLGNDGFLYHYVLYTLHRDRDREPLFSIVPISVPIRVLVPCSMYEPLH